MQSLWWFHTLVPVSTINHDKAGVSDEDGEDENEGCHVILRKMTVTSKMTMMNIPIPVSIINHDEMGVVGVQRWTGPLPDLNVGVVPQNHHI